VIAATERWYADPPAALVRSEDPTKLGWRLVEGGPILDRAGLNMEKAMATLHIQHAITDFGIWESAFNRFADARRRAGVRAHRIQRPVDNSRFVVIDLDFDSTEEAQSFLGFLSTQVWASPETSPGLAGTPEAMILEPAAI
jgi:hypothetical protein